MTMDHQLTTNPVDGICLIHHPENLSFESNLPVDVCPENKNANNSFANEHDMSFTEILSNDKHGDGTGANGEILSRPNLTSSQFKNTVFNSSNLFDNFCDSDISQELEIDMHSLSPDHNDIETMTTVANDNHNSSVAVGSLFLLGTAGRSNCVESSGVVIGEMSSFPSEPSLVNNVETVKNVISQLAIDYKLQFIVFGCYTDDKSQVFSHAIGPDAVDFNATTNCRQVYKEFCDSLSAQSSLDTKASGDSENATLLCKRRIRRKKNKPLKKQRRHKFNINAIKCDDTQNLHEESIECTVDNSVNTSDSVNADGTVEVKVQNHETTSKEPEKSSEKEMLTAESDLDSFQKFRCNLCDYKTHFKKNLQEHMALHGKPSLTCDICHMTFNLQKDLDWHKTFTHKCQDCEKTFETLPELKRHEKDHKTDKLICKICQKKFTRIDSLERHLKMHEEGKPHVCETCNKSFKRLDTLNKHQSVHLMQRPYICDICGKGLTRLEYLVAHKRIHAGFRPFMCEQCGKQYYSASDLAKHSRKCPAAAQSEEELTTNKSKDNKAAASNQMSYQESCEIIVPSLDLHSFSIHDSFLSANNAVCVPSVSLNLNPQSEQHSVEVMQQSCTQPVHTNFYTNAETGEHHGLFNSYFEDNLWCP